MKTASTSLLDASAISLSGLCMAHCLALPLVAAFSPLLAAWAEAEWVHVAVILMAAPLSAMALWRRGQRPAVIALAVGGLSLMGLGLWPFHTHETLLTVAGSLLLACAHLVNWRRRHAH
ncbi:MAG: MerC domain-containing protein [Phenylobacterium sp.]|uniref:MerC domain-containing protein n=1 Tax=Phenylobacterium sp. TaxID=1871053 RepID=UPI0027268196|nr:MerC domain-containing protein [Phenylobacterium sp.]MDO9432102.1 MerC domain-containing protein [Phenylobacterium sp.]